MIKLKRLIYQIESNDSLLKRLNILKQELKRNGFIENKDYRVIYPNLYKNKSYLVKFGKELDVGVLPPKSYEFPTYILHHNNDNLIETNDVKQVIKFIKRFK